MKKVLCPQNWCKYSTLLKLLPMSQLKNRFFSQMEKNLNWILLLLKPSQCWTQSMFRDAVYSCHCKFRLVIPPGWGLRRWNFLILTTPDSWKRHFWEQNYIENCFYVLRSTKSTKTTFQKCWRNIIWADFFGCPYHSIGIKLCLGLPVPAD